MQAGERCLADQSAGDIEVIAVFVGAGTDNGIIEGYGIGFSDYDMLAQFWPAGELVGRTGPNRLCPKRKVDFHETPSALDHLGGLVLRPQAGIGKADHADVRPCRHAEARAMGQEILSEVDMGLAGIEAGIEMSKAYRDEIFRAHDVGGAKQSAHRE